MKNAKHTPGPWMTDIDNNDETLIRTTGTGSYRRIANLGPNAGQLPATLEANARLIAAAPEMYALLERILNDKLKQQGGYCASFVQEINGLLRKATGGAE